MLALLFVVALADPVSYSRDIAPLLAFHCNRCHGDQGAAGGVDTRSHQSLLQSANLPLLLELLEGKRGEARRMPLEAPPLSASSIGKFRRWIASGAQEDRDTLPAQRIRQTVSQQPEFRLEVRLPGQGYVTLEFLASDGRVLHREAGVVRGQEEWTVRSASHWPAQLTLVLTARYNTAPASLRLR